MRSCDDSLQTKYTFREEYKITEYIGQDNIKKCIYMYIYMEQK